MPLVMEVQVIRSGKGSATLFTPVGFFSGVFSHVSGELIRSSE